MRCINCNEELKEGMLGEDYIRCDVCGNICHEDCYRYHVIRYHKMYYSEGYIKDGEFQVIYSHSEATEKLSKKNAILLDQLVLARRKAKRSTSCLYCGTPLTHTARICKNCGKAR
ncbi:MAG: hypothetical protein ACFFCQ_03430 [Promethearchaeota archaeon]